MPNCSTTGIRAVLLAGILVFASALISCGEPTAGQGGGPKSKASAKAAIDQGTPEEDPKDAIAVSALEVSQEPLSAIYTTSATLRSDQQALITARTAGVIHRLLVEEGDPVETGQVLAILENDEQKINFDKSVTTRDNKLRELERARNLHEQGLMSDEIFETTRREAEESRHNAELDDLMLKRTVIRSPFSGIILTRHVDVGRTVNNGDAIYDLADLDPLYADVSVPEREIGTLSTGQQVRLNADASGVSVQARIQRIAPLVDSSTGTVKVTLAVDQSTDLRPGSFVKVSIITNTHEQALVVPRSALVAEGRRWHLFRLKQDGKHVEQLEVLLGYEEGDRVEILEALNDKAQLLAGDNVIHLGASALTDGAQVVIIDPAQDDTDNDSVEPTTEEDAGVTT
jgi:membrane fusion protein (multidrug efflux system)